MLVDQGIEGSGTRVHGMAWRASVSCRQLKTGAGRGAVANKKEGGPALESYGLVLFAEKAVIGAKVVSD